MCGMYVVRCNICKFARRLHACHALVNLLEEADRHERQRAEDQAAWDRRLREEQAGWRVEVNWNGVINCSYRTELSDLSFICNDCSCLGFSSRSLGTEWLT